MAEIDRPLRTNTKTRKRGCRTGLVTARKRLPFGPVGASGFCDITTQRRLRFSTLDFAPLLTRRSFTSNQIRWYPQRIHAHCRLDSPENGDGEETVRGRKIALRRRTVYTNGTIPDYQALCPSLWLCFFLRHDRPRSQRPHRTYGRNPAKKVDLSSIPGVQKSDKAFPPAASATKTSLIASPSSGSPPVSIVAHDFRPCPWPTPAVRWISSNPFPAFRHQSQTSTNFRTQLAAHGFVPSSAQTPEVRSRRRPASTRCAIATADCPNPSP